MIDLVMHTTCAIADAYQGRSQLPRDVLKLRGFSSPMVRRLLNNLCHFDGCRFLEVGAFCGATAISASYNNNGRFITIDNFSEFDGYKECRENLEKYRDKAKVNLITSDVWEVPLTGLAPLDVFFYDGAHDAASTQRALMHFAPILADKCVVLIDDWNWEHVRAGARAAKLSQFWYPRAQWELFTKGNCDSTSWWNGLFIGVYTKRAG